MDSLTTAVFTELFSTAEERTYAPPGLPEVTLKGGVPSGNAAIKVAHETIIGRGYSKISTASSEEICYSRLKSGGSIEYRSLSWDSSEKKITPGSISEPSIENPFPSEIVEGFPIGISP